MKLHYQFRVGNIYEPTNGAKGVLKATPDDIQAWHMGAIYGRAVPITEEFLSSLGATIHYTKMRLNLKDGLFLELSSWTPFKYALCYPDDFESEIRQVEFIHELQNVYYWITGEEIC